MAKVKVQSGLSSAFYSSFLVVYQMAIQMHMSLPVLSVFDALKELSCI